MIDNIDELTQNEAIAHFKAGLRFGDPDSYTLDEKREIFEQMQYTSKAIEDAMKKDFEILPPEFRVKPLEMICTSGCESEKFWKNLLLVEVSDNVGEIVR